ncbi:hypothetical protein FQN57_004965 [Myotisia sp. PD_48]|nr:hypothetical protein FQN57_004965 [Myotisia sp. PD_48]
MAGQPRIVLIDNTCPPAAESTDTEDTCDPSSLNISRLSLSKKFSRSSVQKNLARRKYAKYQSNRYGSMIQDDDDLSRESSNITRQGSPARERSEARDSIDTTAGPSSVVRLPDSQAPSTAGAAAVFSDEESQPQGPADGESQPEDQTEVDVLYENQRGWFFFGMPMYSENSLLNLDPPAWMTAEYEQSPVNITNAQVPDPSWKWAWKTWYVDMSYDVDEEGWQYSFSFASRFSWHGTHPWCHSFVRRRRWLRKRVRTKSTSRRRETDGVGACRQPSLTDYFTVGTASINSREPSITTNGGLTLGHGSRLSTGDPYEEQIAPEDITNIVVLSKAIKMATLDREKIDVVKEFVYRGGEELIYLESQMSDIMSQLVFQSSRKQLLDFLQRLADTMDDSKRQTKQYLLNAINAGREKFHHTWF